MFKVEVMKMAYQQGETEFEDEEQENGEDHAASPRNVGHNIYILAHQVHTLLYIRTKITFFTSASVGYKENIFRH